MNREMAFVHASLRTDASAAAAIAEAVVLVRDWSRVVEIAERHDVTWWVHRALPTEGVPTAQREALAASTRVLAGHALAATAQLAALLDVLRAAGVPALAYKGPSLAADVHGDVAARRFTDLDVLIAERDLPRARSALAVAGYGPPAGISARAAQFYHAYEGVDQLEHHGQPFAVELHWRCHARRYGAPQDPGALFGTARPLVVGGVTVTVPGREDGAALLALHGVKHAWASLQWVADFAHAVQRDAFDWTRLCATMQRWGQGTALHIALLVADALLAVEVPPLLLTEARANTRAVRLARAATDTLCERPAADVGRESTPRYDLQWIDGPLARARYIALAAALPTPREREALPASDAWRYLAYPLRAARLLGRLAGGRR